MRAALHRSRAKRDDRDRLKRVLALAQAWYGQPRVPISMVFDAVTTRLPLNGSPTDLIRTRIGTMFDKLFDGELTQTLNAVVTERRFDLVKNATAIATGFGYQPEFANVL